MGGGKRPVLKVRIPDELSNGESAISSSSSVPRSPYNPLTSSLSFSRPARYRHDSVDSNQSERGRSGFRTPLSKRPSSHGPATSGYQDSVFVFDSRSARSSSQNSVASITSVGSAASGRRGPLSEMAKAGMKAVRKLGACWKCKFLRKTVSKQTALIVKPQRVLI